MLTDNPAARSLEVLWNYLSYSLSGGLRRAALDNSIRCDPLHLDRRDCTL